MIVETTETVKKGQNLSPEESCKLAVMAAINYHQCKKRGNNEVRRVLI